MLKKLTWKTCIPGFWLFSHTSRMKIVWQELISPLMPKIEDILTFIKVETVWMKQSCTQNWEQLIINHHCKIRRRKSVGMKQRKYFRFWVFKINDWRPMKTFGLLHWQRDLNEVVWLRLFRIKVGPSWGGLASNYKRKNFCLKNIAETSIQSMLTKWKCLTRDPLELEGSHTQ